MSRPRTPAAGSSPLSRTDIGTQTSGHTPTPTIMSSRAGSRPTDTSSGSTTVP